MKKFLLTLACVLFAWTAGAQFYSDYAWTTIPDHDDWLYKTGENASVEVIFVKYGIPRDGVLSYEISDDMQPADVKGTVEMKHGRAVIPAGTRTNPGFRDIRLTLQLDGSTYRTHVKVGFSPEEIVPFTKEPADFTAFWSKAIAEAEKFPLTVTREAIPERNTMREDCFLVKVMVNETQGLYGYLYVPKGVEPHTCPVVIFPPGAGVSTIIVPNWHNYYTNNRFIRFVIEIHGIDPRSEQSVFSAASRAMNVNGAGYLGNGIESRDDYYMKHVYLALVRAIDYLTTLPEWDGKNVVMKGGSQGGALSLVAAGLDKRVTVCVADHPALADMAAYAEPGRTGGYPHFNHNPGILTPKAVETLAYFDVVNFARQIKVPTQMSFGYNDDTCPPTTSYAVWNSLKGEKSSMFTPINEHWASDATEAAHVAWIMEHLVK